MLAGTPTTPEENHVSTAHGDDIATLAELLHETAQHHDSFEKASAPHDWWDWYAPYLNARRQGRTSEEATAEADRYMEEIHGISRNRAASPS
jgi:hypothetical protein